MHDKVKELALVAQLGPVMLLNYYGKVDALTDSEQEDLEKLTRFAELIVQECAKVADETQFKLINFPVSIALNEHFGVEE